MTRAAAFALAFALLAASLAFAAPALAQPPGDAGPERGRGGPPDRGNDTDADDRGRGPPSWARGGTARDDQGPPEWAGERRNVSFAANDTGFAFTSERASDRARDAIHAAFAARNASFNVTYDDARGGDASPLGLSVHFRSLLEYRDLDGDGRYSIGDEVVQQVQLKDRDDVDVTTVAAPNGGRKVQATYPLNGGGNLTLLFVVTSVVQEMPNTTVAPTETKFDVVLDAFPFVANDTAVALVTRAAAGRDFQADAGNATLPGLSLREGDVEAFYRWLPFSTVDGVNESVGVTVLSERLAGGDGNGTVVVFSYARGEHIVHDPTIGFTLAADVVEEIVRSLVKGDWRLFGAGLLAAAALVAVTAGPRLRKR